MEESALATKLSRTAPKSAQFVLILDRWVLQFFQKTLLKVLLLAHLRQGFVGAISASFMADFVNYF